MKAWEKYTFTTLAALITVTGVAYFWMKYMLAADDPFAVVNHPLQGLMLQLHVLAAPAFLVVFGIIFNSHIGRKIGKKIPNRRSGILSLVTLTVMTGSGYLLQVLTNEETLRWMMITHVASGSVFALAYVTHLTISVRMWARDRRSAREPAAA